MVHNDIICYFIGGTGCKKSREKKIQELLSSSLNVPVENVKYKCDKLNAALKCIKDTYYQSYPFKEESVFINTLTDEIISDLTLKKNKFVFIIGHSYGGAIVNRIAQILNLSNIEKKYLSKLNMFTRGSIFMAPKDTVNKINILNYISISDIAIKCNKIQPIPFENLPVILNYNGKIICRLQKQNLESNTIQICLYNIETNKPNKPLCNNKISLSSLKEHNRYKYMTHLILLFKNINIYTFPKKQKDNLPYLTYDLLPSNKPIKLTKNNLKNKINKSSRKSKKIY